MSNPNPKYDELVSILLEMFGSEHLPNINKAISLCNRNNQVPNAETAIEKMFEIINNEEDEDTEMETTNTVSFADLAGAMPVFTNEANEVSKTPSDTSEFLPDNYYKVINLIEKGFKVLVLLRGLPGSGKSFLATKIVKHFGFDVRNHIFSADDYFYDAYGRYKYNVEKLSEAHNFNQNRAQKKMREGWSPIFIDNTNLKQWEMIPYVKFAVGHHYLVEILEPVTPWSRKAAQLEGKNQHHVPKDKIQRMMENYERTDVRKLLQIIDCESHVSLEPALRHQPPFSKEFFEQNKHRFPEMFDETLDGAKPQRNMFEGKSLAAFSQQKPQESSQEMNWQSFENDEFWSKYNSNTKQVPQPPPKEEPKTSNVQSNEPKPQRNNLLKSLREATIEVTSKKPKPKDAPMKNLEVPSMEKHKKDCINENKTFREVRNMFPSIGIQYLWDLFVNCNGNGDWTSDLLFQDENACNFQSDDNDDFDCNCDKPVPPAPPTTNTRASNKTYQPKPAQNSNAKPSTSKKVDHPIDAAALEATKRLIEGSFVIGDEHYSDHTRKIRALRNPKPPPAMPQNPQVLSDSSSPEVIDADQMNDEEELVEVDLGITLVQQLERMFGGNEFAVDDNGKLVMGDLKLNTNVFMHKTLANQMYAMWCESLYNQLEEQKQIAVREDLEFARQLDAREKYPGLFKEAPPKDFKDIIDIEMSLAAYKADISKWKNEIPDTMATRLGRDKLRAIFPNFEQDFLDEMLAAHRNDVNETIKVLQGTINNDTDLIERRSKELFAKAQSQINEFSTTHQMYEDESEDDDYTSKLSPDDAKRSALREFQESRNIAQHHHQLKAECYAKARNAIQRNEHSVALYYSQIADLHKSKIDYYNHKAANCLMEAHNLSQNSKDQLDLHYLHSTEAIQCLDMFLDKHINKIKKNHRTMKYVFVITGRGAHSMNGIPAIKIRVKARLRDRDLKFSEVNPGLLKVKLVHNSKFASDADVNQNQS